MLLQSLLDHASDLVQEMTLDGQLTYVNASWRQVLGYAEGEWEGLSGFEVMLESWRSPFLTLLQQVWDTQTAAQFATILRHRQGQEIAVNGQIVFDPSPTDPRDAAASDTARLWILWRQIPSPRSLTGIPQIVGQLGAYMGHQGQRLLTELMRDRHQMETVLKRSNADLERQRQRVEKSLQHSEEHRRLALDFNHIGSWDWHINTNELLWNDNHCTILGYSPDITPTYTLWRDRLHPEDAERTEAALSTALRTHTDLEMEYRIQLPDGTVRWVMTQARGLYDEHGVPVRMVGVMIDMSDRKQSELALQQREEQLRLALVAAKMGTWQWDFTPGSQFWSETLESLFGFAPGEFDGRIETFYDRIHPEDLQRIQALDRRMHAIGGEFQVIYRIVRPDDSQRWLRSQGRVYTDAQGQPTRILGVTLDITEAKAAEAKILQALAQERELSELKSRFVSMVSHEVRTPLTTIMSSVDVLQNIPCDETERQELFALIQSSIRRMVQLLENSLSLGLRTAGTMALQPTEFDLVAFCQQLLQDLQSSLGWEHRLHLDWDAQASWVCLDATLLRQILNNLLSNAIKYSAAGSPVTLRVIQGRDRLQFQIQDQGIGIPPEDHPHLFDDFYRARNVGTVEGTGLGLALVKNSVERHGGEITLVSDLGQGTTFTVTLPLTQMPGQTCLPPHQHQP